MNNKSLFLRPQSPDLALGLVFAFGFFVSLDVEEPHLG